MDKDDRMILIRRGNELYNRGDYKSALKLFLYTEYQDGIVRVADHLYYEENDQISAIKLYKKAGYRHRVDEFAEKAAYAIQLWLEEDKAEVVSVSADDLRDSEEAEVVIKNGKKLGVEKWEPRVLSGDDVMGAQVKTGDIEKAFKKDKKNKK